MHTWGAWNHYGCTWHSLHVSVFPRLCYSQHCRSLGDKKMPLLPIWHAQQPIATIKHAVDVVKNTCKGNRTWMLPLLSQELWSRCLLSWLKCISRITRSMTTILYNVVAVRRRLFSTFNTCLCNSVALKGLSCEHPRRLCPTDFESLQVQKSVGAKFQHKLQLQRRTIAGIRLCSLPVQCRASGTFDGRRSFGGFEMVTNPGHILLLGLEGFHAVIIDQPTSPTQRKTSLGETSSCQLLQYSCYDTLQITSTVKPNSTWSQA